jgi:CheY-like chemotaxis protein
VLIVDDDPDIREGLADVLRAVGYRVETARNGAEALRVVQRSQPCLMLLDLMMPVLDGWQVIDQVEREHLDVPYCVMSAATTVPEHTCTLRKPLELTDLLRVVEQHCRKPGRTL